MHIEIRRSDFYSILEAWKGSFVFLLEGIYGTKPMQFGSMDEAEEFIRGNYEKVLAECKATIK